MRILTQNPPYNPKPGPIPSPMLMSKVLAELKMKKRSSIGMMDARGSSLSLKVREDNNYSALSKTPITQSRKKLSPLK